ncbi:DNA methyltransferase [Algoriphagus mannitolivorans]|uniref:DNA methyltransferase n=1 Tax=Algoriphagus mannitolivorans TaxID=226504 RepID=UPI000427E1A9|nr:DNA methyltransferase [Algoriphagus mannitolivorans]
MEKYLTIGEAAKKLEVSTETLRRWDNSGKFSSIRHPINNYRVYSENQLNSFADELQLEIRYLKSSDLELVSNPFFESKLGKLYQMDAISYLKTLESNSIDLIFSDPPYNIGKADWDTFTSQKDYLDWCYEWIRESHRVLKKTGSLYVCGFSEILSDIKWVTNGLFHSTKWLIWFYRNKANLGKDWGRSHESILHLRKSKNFYFNIDEVRIPYNDHTLKYPERSQAETSQYSKGDNNKHVWKPNPLGAKPKDVFEIPTISNGSWERFPHLTQKPVELLRKIILSSSKEGDLVLDPFGGSGTTFAVSEAYGRKWLGTELNENHCKIIRERLSDSNHLKRIHAELDTRKSNSRRKKLRGE